MIRTQIQLPEDQVRLLKITARREGVSISEVIRQSLSKTLASANSDIASRYARAASLVGSFHDATAPDLAEHHDDYLVDAFSR